MAYKVTENCTNCGACEPECPVSAITEVLGARSIDADMCTECGICVDACPVEAIILG